MNVPDVLSLPRRMLFMLSYILHHLDLVWRFVKGDKEALYDVDASMTGLWRSFIAILLVEPVSMLYAALFGFLDRMLLFRPGGGIFYLFQLALDWGAVPILLFILGGFLGFRHRLVPLIVSYNWMSVIVLAITLIPGALISSGIASQDVGFLLMVGMYGFSMWLSFRLFQFVLECPMSMALGLTVLVMIVTIASAALLNGIASELPTAQEAAQQGTLPQRH